MYGMGTTIRLSEIEKGRENQSFYIQFCEKFIPCILGKIKFKVNCYVKNLSDYCSVSDEAMAIPIYANNVSQWHYKMKYPPPTKKDVYYDEEELRKVEEEKRVYNKNVPVQKYFDENKGRGHSYGQDVCTYFNVACNKIIADILADRKKHGEQFSEGFLLHMKKNKQNTTDKGHKMVRCFVDDDESGRGKIPFHTMLDDSCV